MTIRDPRRMTGFFSRIIRYFFQNRLWRNHFPWRPVATYVGAGQSTNLGDWLIFNVISSDLHGIGLYPVIPRHFRHALPQSLVSSFLYVLFAGYRQRKVVILGGGTLIGSGHFHGMYLPYAQRALVVYATSANKVGQAMLAKEMALYTRAVAVGVRDPHTRACFVEHGFAPAPPVIGDPVLRYPFKQYPQTERRACLGINFGPTMREPWQPGVMDELITWLARDRSPVRQLKLIAFTPQDMEMLQAFVDRLPVSAEYTLIEAHLHQGAAAMLMEGVDFFIGERLHSAIVAVASGLIPISINYSEKCRHFMESVGLSDFCIEPADFSGTQLDRLLALMDREGQELAARAQQGISEYRDLSASYADRVMGMVREA